MSGSFATTGFRRKKFLKIVNFAHAKLIQQGSALFGGSREIFPKSAVLGKIRLLYWRNLALFLVTLIWAKFHSFQLSDAHFSEMTLISSISSRNLWSQKVSPESILQNQKSGSTHAGFVNHFLSTINKSCHCSFKSARYDRQEGS